MLCYRARIFRSMMHRLLMRLKLGQSFDALAGDVEIKLELETMTTLQDDHKWSAPPKRSRDLTKMAISKTHHRAVLQDHHSGVTLVGLVSQVLSRLISTDRARHPMSVVASSIVACVIGLRNQSNPLNTVQSATQIVNN